MKLNRGDIVIANLESVSKGSIQKYTRPYIIISNNKAYQYSPVFTVVDCIGEENVEKSRKVAEKLGIPLRVREYTAE